MVKGFGKESPGEELLHTEEQGSSESPAQPCAGSFGLESSSIHTQRAAHRLPAIPSVTCAASELEHPVFAGLIFLPALEELDRPQGQVAASFPKV